MYILLSLAKLQLNADKTEQYDFSENFFSIFEEKTL